MQTIDPASLKVREVYQLLISSIIPRPIAFVSTLSPDGEGNLAPFSAFNLVSSNPPCLSIAISRRRDGSKKDTLRNIEETKEFVVNVACHSFLPQLVQTGADYPPEVDEREVVKLTALPSQRVKPVRIAESPLHFECVLENSLAIGDGSAGSAVIVVGRIVLVHVSESALRDGRIQPLYADIVGRLGGDDYCRLSPDFSQPIPKV